jgi:hypothetical protein
MRTVTLIARSNGYALGMNRDEKLNRPTALPIAGRLLDSGRSALFPSEPNGGTWIGVNDTGVGFALVNWYAINARVEGRATSRGEVVKTALSLSSPWDLKETPSGLDLYRVNPFRLIGVFPDEKVVFEWRWDLRSFERFEHQWLTSSWFSSGFDEPGAQRPRGETLNAALRQRSYDSLSWLRRLHASHVPERGPYSICMHRSDAATVSYAEMVVDRGAVNMWYTAGAPFCNAVSSTCHLPLRR